MVFERLFHWLSTFVLFSLRTFLRFCDFHSKTVSRLSLLIMKILYFVMKYSSLLSLLLKCYSYMFLCSSRSSNHHNAAQKQRCRLCRIDDEMFRQGEPASASFDLLQKARGLLGREGERCGSSAVQNSMDGGGRPFRSEVPSKQHSGEREGRALDSSAK